MKKILSLLLAVALLCCGCGNKTPEETTPPTTQPSGPVANPVALTVGTHEITRAELDLYYIDAVTKYCNQYSSYLSYLFDLYAPLSGQVADEKTGKTWADAFYDMAITSIKTTYALCDAANAAGHQLSQAEKDARDELYEGMDEFAKQQGFANADAYLKDIYGEAVDTEAFRHYYETTLLAGSYYNAYLTALEDSYDDAALREYEKDISYQFDSYSYASTLIPLENFTDEADPKAALVDAVQMLADPQNDTPDKLDAAIKAMEQQYGIPSHSPATQITDAPYSKISTMMNQWMRDPVRKAGDITAIVYETEKDGQKNLAGYYVVLFLGRNDNQIRLTNVRHILVAFEGGTKDAATGQTTYSEAEKENARQAAQALLDQWKQGEATEDSFAQLANKESDDGDGTTGGLYENIYPGQMVPAFNDWCFDESRQPGDTGLLESVYGYHVMYFSSHADITYRDHMIIDKLIDRDMEQWQDSLNKSMTLTEVDTSYVQRDLVLKDLLM